ncbi:cyclophilin-like fold protein [Thermanaeromonas sp. C210]|uniref:cyclophilin-like fold protein n=1 Tax=Thermanaeromonas sp. C210 TaxID=2731925 RepID=UPI00155D3CC9|nr:cyclophilin-like fold protein [Thermanaeromonas sp. C210]GFN21842.1 hypothetical protein TAMC210_01580 [Thermanaeromonas sp. C210]
MRILFEAAKAQIEIELNDTATSQKVREALPLEARVNTWGDEIYFSIPVHTEQEKPQELVNEGDVAYWPPGHALCLFFGPTPISAPGEIRPYSPVTVVGKVVGDPKVLKNVKDGEKVQLRKIPSP